MSFHQLLEIEKAYHQAVQSYWNHHNFLTARWWFLVALSIFPALIWWKLLNKRHVTEITAFGLFYGVSAIILDSMGSNMMVWAYPYSLTPYLNPQLYPYDVGVVIIPFMLIYQRWREDFKKFFLFAGLLSAFLAFAAEPFMEWLNIYEEIIWKNIYSFPIYWLLSLICWGIIKYFKTIEKTSGQKDLP
jgi:membrane-bound metal-dependent hydrolase YbcI (DUF457 family)